MFKTLAQSIIRHHHSWPLYNSTCLKTLSCSRNFIVLKPDALIRQYGTELTYTVEKETFNYKILEHMRTKAVYSAIPNNEEKLLPISSASNDKYAIKQLSLVIAHNPEIIVNDIVQLFSLCAFSQHNVIHDIISDKSLMKTLLAKVFQSLPLMKPLDIQQLAVSLRKLIDQQIAISLEKPRDKKIGYLIEVANNIVIHCEQKALKSDLRQSLELFDIMLILYGNNVFWRRQYDTFMSIFEDNINSAQPYDLVQILHYIGLGKRKFTKEFADKAMRKLEPNFHTLPFSDAGIAACGIFKAGVNVDGSFVLVHKTAQHLKSKIKEPSLLNDLERHGLVAMIKLLRFARYQDDELLFLISEFLLKVDESVFSPTFISNVLAFYANSQVYQKEIFSKLEYVFLEHLKTSPRQIRIKDFSKLLWCFSHTGHKCTAQLLTESDKYLIKCIPGKETKKSPHFLSDSLFSLAVLGHYSSDLVKEAFKPEMIKGLTGHQRSKQLSRLLALYECLKVEVPDLTVEKPAVSPVDLPVRTLSNETFYRPGLAKLMEGAEYINEIVGAKVLKLKFVLPSINYANLILDFNQLKHVVPVTSTEQVQQDHIIYQLSLVEGKNLAIELLDFKTLLHESSEPIGIIRLKLRLMRQIGWNVKEVLFNEVEECGNDTKAVAALILDKLMKCN